MKIYVLCDIEGAAGVVDFETQAYPGGKYLDQARRWATLELNALIDGCIEGGAEDIVVLDGHGPGGLSFELLHDRARMILGRPLTVPFGIDESFDALLLCGHHAMNHTPRGVLCHSWSSKSIDECRLNGEPIGEIGVNLAMGGSFGVRSVFVSGDDTACDEARRYVPNLECAVTKQGLSRTSALSLSLPASRRLHHERGLRALQRLSEFEPFTVEPPYEFSTKHVEPVERTPLMKQNGVELIDDHTTVVRGDDLIDVLARR